MNFFLKVGIRQTSEIVFKTHMCGILGMYVAETAKGKDLFYGPYCNLSEFDVLNGNDFEFVSYTKKLNLITYNFHPALEPFSVVNVSVQLGKCQGVANVCFMFSFLTPPRYTSILSPWN